MKEFGWLPAWWQVAGIVEYASTTMGLYPFWRVFSPKYERNVKTLRKLENKKNSRSISPAMSKSSLGILPNPDNLDLRLDWLATMQWFYRYLSAVERTNDTNCWHCERSFQVTDDKGPIPTLPVSVLRRLTINSVVTMNCVPSSRYGAVQGVTTRFLENPTADGEVHNARLVLVR